MLLVMNHQGLGALQEGDNIRMEIERFASFAFTEKDPQEPGWTKQRDREMAQRLRGG